ncbi:Ribonuclease H-like domain containing protein [Trema orientale]|uniref:Ribonuclease H-like domain containing protein n=1 Tax=Trema orientale TaxID=63057 RepID=A0A2P5CGP2_TREOI|nr:Ribonuclease H-like domain containing protein [Trema orientale]
MNFNLVAFWVQFFNVPIVCLTEDCAKFWGSQIGVVEEAEVVGVNMRARIQIDVTKPFCRGIHCSMDEIDGKVSLLLRYEFLSEFCYSCGIIGDRAREYPKHVSEDDVENLQVPLRYRAWLRAPNLGSRIKSDNESRQTYNRDIKKLSQSQRGDVDSNEFRSSHITEAQELEEEMELFGVCTVEELAARRDTEFHNRPDRTPVLVPGDGRNISEVEQERIIRGAKTIILPDEREALEARTIPMVAVGRKLTESQRRLEMLYASSHLAVKDVWKETGLWDIIKSGACTNIADLLVSIFYRCPRDQFDFFCVLLWCLWTDRNMVVHSGKHKSAHHLVDFARTFLLEFKESSTLSKDCGSLSLIPRQRWIASPIGCFKLSTDAAVHPAEVYFSIGAVVRDHEGVVVAALARGVNGVLLVENAELIALHKGLRFAIDVGCSPTMAECDTSKIVNGLKSLNPLAVNAPLFSDILSFMSFARCGSCHYIPRCRNRVAHNLASHVFTRPSDMYWVESIPAFISSSVIEDLI